MARGRMLNNSVSASLKFHNLPDDTCRLLATWTIARLDMRGVFYADPAMVRAIIFPRRHDVSLEQVEYYLEAMESAALMVCFEANGDTWQYWPGFADNQIGLRADRERTDYPAPPDWIEEQSGKVPDTIPPTSGECPAEEKRRESNIREEKKRIEDKTTEPSSSSDFLSEAIHAYENTIGIISGQHQAEEIKAVLCELEEDGLEDWWPLALDVAADQNARSWAYVRGVLRKCRAEGHPPNAGRRDNHKRGPPEPDEFRLETDVQAAMDARVDAMLKGKEGDT